MASWRWIKSEIIAEHSTQKGIGKIFRPISPIFQVQVILHAITSEIRGMEEGAFATDFLLKFIKYKRWKYYVYSRTYVLSCSSSWCDNW